MSEHKAECNTVLFAGSLGEKCDCGAGGEMKPTPLSEKMLQDLEEDRWISRNTAHVWWRQVAALEADNARLKQQLEAERKKCEAMRKALVEAAIPLEVIAGALNIGDMQEISVEVAQQIHKAVSLIRAALAEPAQEFEPVCEDCDTESRCHGAGNCPGKPSQPQIVMDARQNSDRIAKLRKLAQPGEREREKSKETK